MKAPEGKYAYGIIKTTQPCDWGPIGMGDQRVYTIGYKDLAMVVSDSPLVYYDPDQENALRHEGVLSKIMEESTVLPFTFGVIFKRAEDVVNLLKGTYEEFSSLLADLAGKIEVGLKILWRKDAFQKVMGEHRLIQDLKSRLVEGGQNNYLEQVQLGDLVMGVVERKRKFYLQEIHRPLEKLAEGAKINDPVHERMLLNAAYLVDKKLEERFDQEVDRLYSLYKEELDFKYTGPWPPYNFVTVRLKIQ